MKYELIRVFYEVEFKVLYFFKTLNIDHRIYQFSDISEKL